MKSSGQAARHQGRPAKKAPQDCGDLGLRIDRGGGWFYHGSPIDRKEMVCLFAGMLRRHDDGSYWLETEDETGTIEVDDVPFLAVELFTFSCGRDQVVSFRTNVDELVTVDDDHPLRVAECPDTGEPLPYVYLRDGLEARLARPVYYELVARGVEEKVGGDDLYGVWSSGIFFPLGRLSDSD
ncbi:DUF1285 domain-containing protein [Magnetospirillum sp. UT-4]|uniref:DUF1285 domain-containing protein n=1 Tax=Magnetospirillum sp. UT-4 TaxID=2681467 RepID=UPI001382E06D|nr:DUF1285 domain-containing protein [Magnetospirillum sp. UT-4]CAA7617684.1 conserved hypothetical protein [Magnetospirillum sp. UT-4]